MELPRTLTAEEQSAIDAFEIAATRYANSLTKIVSSQWNLPTISANLHFDLTKYPKEGVVVQALWIALIKIYRNLAHIPFKYETLDDFLRSYDEVFFGTTDSEIHKLWQTANWMAILLQLVPPKKNKGLVMAVVPKIVEGWLAKYITGSGQTKATADRVKIFETEGNVKACHRNCQSRVKVKIGDSSSSSEPSKKRVRPEARVGSGALPIPEYNSIDALRAMAYYDRLRSSGIVQSSQSIEDLITGNQPVESLIDFGERALLGRNLSRNLSQPRMLRNRSIEPIDGRLLRNRSIESVDGDFMEMLEIFCSRSISQGFSTQVRRDGLLTHTADMSLNDYDQEFIDMVSLLRSVSEGVVSQVRAASMTLRSSTSSHEPTAAAAAAVPAAFPVAPGSGSGQAYLKFILVDESGEKPASLTLKH